VIQIAFKLGSRWQPRWCLLLVLCFVPVFHAQEPPGKEPKAATWTVLSLHIERKPKSVESDGTGDGTQLRAKIELPDRFIVGVDSNGSTFNSWKDDKGTNLLATPLRLKEWKTLERDRTAEGGKSATVFLRAGGVPAPGASKLVAKGKLAVFVGKDEKKIEKKNVVFLAGVDLGFGNVKGGGKGFKSSLRYIGIRPIKEAEIDVEGKTLQLRILNTKASFQVEGKPEFHIALMPPPFDKTDIRRGTLRITYLEVVETIVVPFDLEIGLGL
jgi:hypothetical protein